MLRLFLQNGVIYLTKCIRGLPVLVLLGGGLPKLDILLLLSIIVVDVVVIDVRITTFLDSWAPLKQKPKWALLGLEEWAAHHIPSRKERAITAPEEGRGLVHVVVSLVVHVNEPCGVENLDAKR